MFFIPSREESSEDSCDCGRQEDGPDPHPPAEERGSGEGREGEGRGSQRQCQEDPLQEEEETSR